MRQVSTRMLAPVAVLAGLTVIWSALPLRAGLVAGALLWIAVVAAVCSLAELAARTIEFQRSVFETPADRLVRLLVTAVRSASWAEIMMIAVLVLEAEHADRPWHTGVLMIALLGYLLAVHLAETGEDPGMLRAQLPPLAAGAGLTVLAIGAAYLPGLPAGPLAYVVRFAAAGAAVTVVALVIPTWLPGRG